MKSTTRFAILSMLVAALAACSSDEPASNDSSANAAADAATQKTPEAAAPAAPLEPLPEAARPAEALAEQSADADSGTAGSDDGAEAGKESRESQEHIVRGVVTQWDPMVVFAQPGDSIRFVNMTGHDTQAIDGMIPEGATAWRSKMGEDGFSVTLNAEGVYIYKCNPHITTGMVGAVVVGEPDLTELDEMEATADSSVPVGGNMVKRTIRKLRKAIEVRDAGA